jgi:hypothetical protein
MKIYANSFGFELANCNFGLRLDILGLYGSFHQSVAELQLEVDRLANDLPAINSTRNHQNLQILFDSGEFLWSEIARKSCKIG